MARRKKWTNCAFLFTVLQSGAKPGWVLGLWLEGRCAFNRSVEDRGYDRKSLSDAIWCFLNKHFDLPFLRSEGLSLIPANVKLWLSPQAKPGVYLNKLSGLTFLPVQFFPQFPGALKGHYLPRRQHQWIAGCWFSSTSWTFVPLHRIYRSRWSRHRHHRPVCSW